MITKFKLFENSELLHEVNIKDVVLYFNTNHFFKGISDKIILFDNNENYKFNYNKNKELMFSGSIGNNYDLDSFTKYEDPEIFFKEHKEMILTIFEQIQAMDIDNIANIQQHGAYEMLFNYIAQIEEIKTLMDLEKFNI